MEVNDFEQEFLISIITGIYLHVVLNFYVVKLDSENKASIDKFDFTIEI